MEPACFPIKRTHTKKIVHSAALTPRPTAPSSDSPKMTRVAAQTPAAPPTPTWVESLIENPDIGPLVFVQFVGLVDELCKPHEFVAQIYAVMHGLVIGNAERRALVLRNADVAAKHYWDVLWMGNEPLAYMLKEFRDSALARDSQWSATLRTSYARATQWQMLWTLMTMRFAVCPGIAEVASQIGWHNPVLQMQQAIYGDSAPESNDDRPVWHFEIDDTRIALQFARHVRIDSEEHALNLKNALCHAFASRPYYDVQVNRALLLRPKVGYALWRDLPEAMRRDQKLVVDAITEHPVLLREENIGIDENRELVLHIMKACAGEGAGRNKVWMLYQHCSTYLKNDATFVFEAIKLYPTLYEGLPAYHLSNPLLAYGFVLGHVHDGDPFLNSKTLDHTFTCCCALRSSVVYCQLILQNCDMLQLNPGVVYSLFEETVQIRYEVALDAYRACTEADHIKCMNTKLHISLLADPQFCASTPTPDSLGIPECDQNGAIDVEFSLTEVYTPSTFDTSNSHKLFDVSFPLELVEWTKAASKRNKRRVCGRPIRYHEVKWLRTYAATHDVTIPPELRLQMQAVDRFEKAMNFTSDAGTEGHGLHTAPLPTQPPARSGAARYGDTVSMKLLKDQVALLDSQPFTSSRMLPEEEEAEAEADAAAELAEMGWDPSEDEAGDDSDNNSEPEPEWNQDSEGEFDEGF